ncbi:MAG: SAM-dependent methyltransferase [Chloroflexi bacterium]|nr:SAM-dependent methyltransferase [Chloroflexota bacterium]
MDLATFQTLLTLNGQAAIAGAADLAPTEESFLACLTRLQKRFPAELAKAALETVILRNKARAKFSRAGSMYFTRPALEMASSEIVSRYRARRFAPFTRVADLCCGLGGDTIGLAAPPLQSGGGVRGGGQTFAVDIAPLHLALARANLAAYDLHANFVEADLTQTPPPQTDAYFFDPGRRVKGRRLFSVRDYRPPLSLINSWLPKPLGVKISPGVNLAELADYDCEVEFVSLDGDLKEATLWFGPLKTAARRATILNSSNPPVSLKPSTSPIPSPSLSSPLSFLYEPDPAILRAGLVTTLAGQIGAHQLDPDIAYLTSDSLVSTPFARAFVIEAAMPFSQKRLREKLRAMNVGNVTVKKRGSPLDVDDFARSLKLKGDEERILFLTHVNGKPWVLIGRIAS